MLARIGGVVAILQRAGLHQVLLYVEHIEGVVGEARAPRDGLCVRGLVQQVARQLEVAAGCAEGDLADGDEVLDDAFGVDGREGRRRRCGRRRRGQRGAVAAGGAEARGGGRGHFHGEGGVSRAEETEAGKRKEKKKRKKRRASTSRSRSSPASSRSG
ncbi:hypothetical protein MKX07_008631 [Trichoderma sp. CBMAI-0711]|nr:hypothetical protein MKX07_008631 [Trichoderma sp. CBMAI-0711]